MINSAVIHGLCAMTFQSAMHCLLRLAPTMINHLTSICSLFWNLRLVCFPQVLFQILKVLLVGKRPLNTQGIISRKKTIFCVGTTCSLDSFLHVLVHSFFLVSSSVPIQ